MIVFVEVLILFSFCYVHFFDVFDIRCSRHFNSSFVLDEIKTCQVRFVFS